MAALLILSLLVALILPLWSATRRLRDLPRDAARLRETDNPPSRD